MYMYVCCCNIQLDRAISVAKVTSDCKFVSKCSDFVDYRVDVVLL